MNGESARASDYDAIRTALVWARNSGRLEAGRYALAALERLLAENKRLLHEVKRLQFELYEGSRAENERLRGALREAHDYYCGCEVPGNPSLCVAHEAFDDRAAVPEERG